MTRASSENPPFDDAEILRRVGTRIRELRDERHLSQEGLAERSGGNMSYKHVGAIERGKSNASATSLVRIALGLGVTVGELFGTVTPGQPPRIPRATLHAARECMRSLSAIFDSLDRPAVPPRASASDLPRQSARGRSRK